MNLNEILKYLLEYERFIKIDSVPNDFSHITIDRWQI